MIRIITTLKKIPLFEGLEDGDLNRIAEVVKEKLCPKGTILFRTGDPGDAFYLIKTGKVEVLKVVDGTENVVNTVGADDSNSFFGEMALIANAPRNATIRTTEDSVFLMISKTDFDMMLRLNSFISLRIMTALSKRFRAEEKPVEEKLGKVITVFSPKPGTGKSVFAGNLAAGLAKLAKQKVLLVDLDLQFGDMAFMLGLKYRRTIADLVENPTDTFDVFKEYLCDHPLGFSVLPSPLKPEQSEMIHSSHLRSLITLALKHFDWIILDTHSLFQDLTINAMDLADTIFLLMLPALTHVKSMKVCLEVMANLKYPSEKTKLILNREGSQTALSREDIENGLKTKMSFTLRDNWKCATALVDQGKTVFEHDEGADYRANLGVILSALTGQKIQENDPGMLKKLKGWFGS